jgi:hypothetical protein
MPYDHECECGIIIKNDIDCRICEANKISINAEYELDLIQTHLRFLNDKIKEINNKVYLAKDNIDKRKMITEGFVCFEDHADYIQAISEQINFIPYVKEAEEKERAANECFKKTIEDLNTVIESLSNTDTKLRSDIVSRMNIASLYKDHDTMCINISHLRDRSWNAFKQIQELRQEGSLAYNDMTFLIEKKRKLNIQIQQLIDHMITSRKNMDK